MPVRALGVTIAARVAPVAVVVVALVTILNDALQAVTILRGRTLFVSGGVDGQLPLTHAPQFLQADLREGAHGTLADASLGLRMACALPNLIEIAVILAAAVLLFGIVRRIATAAVFTTPVLRRWRALAIVLIGGGLVQGIADTIGTGYLWQHVRGVGPAQTAFLGGDYQGIGLAGPNWPIPVILIGVIAATLAIAFRAGADLERQTVGVI